MEIFIKVITRSISANNKAKMVFNHLTFSGGVRDVYKIYKYIYRAWVHGYKCIVAVADAAIEC